MPGISKARLIVSVGLLAGILLTIQVTLSALPNIELVTLLITVYSLHFKRTTLYIIYTFVLMEGILYGFGLWWICYLYIWTILHFLTSLFPKMRSPLFWAILNGLFGLLFGAMSSLPYFAMAGAAGGIAYFIAGIPFDMIHCAGNFVAAVLLFRPLDSLLSKAVKRYLY